MREKERAGWGERVREVGRYIKERDEEIERESGVERERGEGERERNRWGEGETGRGATRKINREGNNQK